MRTVLLWSAVMLWSVGAAAQVMTENITVEFTGIPHCKEQFPADSILVVVNGRENDAKPAERSTANPCKWNGLAVRFDAEDAYVSLRLGGRRTECRRVRAVEEGDDAHAEVLYRHRRTASAQALALDAGGATPISYVRHIRGDDPCVESGWYSGVPIADVDFTLESVVLQPAWPEPDRNRPGLILDPPPPNGEASRTWTLFDRNAMRDGDSWTLTAAQYAAIYTHQQSVLRPRLPAGDADVELKRLQQQNVKTIRLTFR